MRPFEELTNAGKARRLRAVAAAALERYHLRVRRLRLITNEFNAVFRVDTDDGRTYVLRVNLPGRRSLAEIEAEMSWLNALAIETAVGVPTPVPADGGDLVVTVSAGGVPEPRHCALFGWIGGVDLAARLTEDNVAELGALTAQLHLHALSFDTPTGLRRWDNPFPLDDRHVLLDDGVVSPADRATFATALDRIEAVLERLSGEQPRMIHGDLHQDNVRVVRGRLFAIDFDDSLLGHPVQDIGVTFWNLQEETNYHALRRAFRRGYERHASWPEHSPGDIDTFVADRALMLIDYALQNTPADEAADTRVFIDREVRHLRRWLSR
jgi:Ser/Thr protein kinase RdoA (MazF antagonist)